ncbi:hypothetical protein [Actinacidiphila epipremni]|uniref:Serine/threonine protein kinase n=1 Tax=Actinacidiphila epipremni TaxID=2053013 RepID=A0ABX0ZMX7_9ACTN|nr:hypothetical protein [Actinacidiphila epipremni]NJP44167.1 hypothetical protein [Actinacidiphila epipremni]
MRRRRRRRCCTGWCTRRPTSAAYRTWCCRWSGRAWPRTRASGPARLPRRRCCRAAELTARQERTLAALGAAPAGPQAGASPYGPGPATTPYTAGPGKPYAEGSGTPPYAAGPGPSPYTAGTSPYAPGTTPYGPAPTPAPAPQPYGPHGGGAPAAGKPARRRVAVPVLAAAGAAVVAAVVAVVLSQGGGDHGGSADGGASGGGKGSGSPSNGASTAAGALPASWVGTWFGEGPGSVLQGTSDVKVTLTLNGGERGSTVGRQISNISAVGTSAEAGCTEDLELSQVQGATVVLRAVTSTPTDPDSGLGCPKGRTYTLSMTDATHLRLDAGSQAAGAPATLEKQG